MKKALIKALKSAKVEFVRSLWCDNANVIRAKSIDIDSLEDNFEAVAGISRAQQGVPVMYDGVVPESGLMPVGEIWLNPDWDTLNVLPYTPGHASVISDLFTGQCEWSLCPRFFLKRSIKALDELGFTMRAAFENEFYLFDRSLDPVDNTLFASSFSMDLNSKVVGDIVKNLKAQFLTVERYYAESGPGQQEVVIAHAPALEAADNQITFRETVRTTAARNGLIASFMPKPFEEFGGSGCHLHFSLLKDGKNVMRDHNGELSEVALYFMAGLLEHLPSLMAVTTPTTNSYRRIKPSCWAGAYRCWGLDNREAALRVPTDPSGSVAGHVELKSMDASSNPYLALGMVIFAGIDGLRKKVLPPVNLQSDPASMNGEELFHSRIEPLPSSLGIALDTLENDRYLLKTMGEDLSRAYLAVKRAEWKTMAELTIAQERQILLERF